MQEASLLILAGGITGAGETGTAQGPAAVLIQGGRIEAVGHKALAAGAGEGIEQLDLRPAWLTPASLDAHVHLWLRGTAAENLAACRKAGLAAVRDLANPPKHEMPLGLADEPPLVVASGPGLCAGGPAKTWLGIECAGPESYASETEARIQAGVGVLKVFATGLLDFDQPGQVEHGLAVSQEEMAAIKLVASKAGLTVAAHTSGDASARACLAAGIDSLEHGFFLERATLELMAERGTAWVPTLAAVEVHAADPEGRHDDRVRENLRIISESQAKAMRLAEELGVNLVLGTDSGSYGLPHGQAVFMEMKSWLKAGLKPATVYEAATSRAAELMGLQGEVGTIAPGARAWLMATESDPRENPLGMQKPVWRNF
jgi:imidazolonepropionase-like amidohydrolase